MADALIPAKTFDQLVKRIHLMTGILIPMDEKNNRALASKLQPVLAEQHFSDFEQLEKKLQLPDPVLLESFISALSSNRSAGFFNDKVQFDFLEKILKVYLADPSKAKDMFRIWSMSGGWGEEAYSISFLVNDLCGSKSRSRFKIHASDLDLRALRKASAGVFAKSELQGLPVETASKYMSEKIDGNYYVSKDIIGGVNFTQFNLMNFDYVAKFKFHFLFCKNILKNFDTPTINHVFQMFAQNLENQGIVFVSESEAALIKHPQFKNMGHGIFQKLKPT